MPRHDPKQALTNFCATKTQTHKQAGSGLFVCDLGPDPRFSSQIKDLEKICFWNDGLLSLLPRFFAPVEGISLAFLSKRHTPQKHIIIFLPLHLIRYRTIYFDT